MLVSSEAYNLLNAKEGDWLYVDEDAAALFSAVVEAAQNTEYKAPTGKYYIGKITKGKSARTITFFHEAWDQKTTPGVVTLVTLTGEVFIKNFNMNIPVELFQVFRNVKELSKINDTRFDCIVCGQRLNIITTNIRICSPCEKKL